MRHNYLPALYRNVPYGGGLLGGYADRISSRVLNSFGIPRINYALDCAIDQVAGKAAASIKNHYGKSFKFRRGDSINVLKWLQAHDNNFKSHIDNPQVLDDPSGRGVEMASMDKNQMFVINLDDGTFAYVHVYNEYTRYSNVYYTDRDRNGETTNTGFYEMDIYIFGKHMRKYAKELTEATASSLSGKLCQYIVMGGESRSEYTITAKEVNMRPIDSLFFSDDTTNRIVHHIENWLKNESIYQQRSLPFKTGILLQGEPGTGKSSLVVALATHFNMEIINVNMPTFRNIDVDRLIDSINADNNKYIVLMEEIDCVFGEADRKGNVDKEDKKYISDLLQFIDSPKSPTNVLFIATTNYPDRLDAALVRKGRFDLIENVGPLTTMESVRSMCKSFQLSEEHIDNICKSIELPIHQSTLQYMIMEEINKQFKTTEDVSQEDEEHIKKLLGEDEDSASDEPENKCSDDYHATEKAPSDDDDEW